MLTTVPSTRNTTLATPLLSVAVAASVTAAPDAKFWFAVGLVSDTAGGVLVLVPIEQAVPFSVKAVGGLLLPVNVPLKATLNVPFVGMALFQSALLAAVTAVPDCVTFTGQPFCSLLAVRQVEHQ